MTIPTFSELQQSVSSDLRNKLEITTVIGKVAVYALSLVQAAKLKIYYLRLDFIYKNIFPDQASSEDVGGTLERFGYVKLGRYRDAAVAGEYIVSVSGTIGAEIAPNTTFVALDSSTSPGQLYVLDSTFTFTATTGQIQLRALEAGTDSRLEVDDQLQITQPLANVDSYATVVSEETAPIEEESISDYRDAIIQDYRLEPQGGAATDIRLWSADADGVRQVYPYTEEKNIVNVYVEANVADSIDGYGTPSTTILDNVTEVIEFDPDTTKDVTERGRRPMSMFTVNVLPIDLVDVDVIIYDLSDTSYLTAIEESITTLLLDIRPYVDSCDLQSESQQGILYEADMYSIVRDVIGINATFTSLEMQIDSVQQSVYTFEGSNIPKLNSVTNV